MKINKYKIVDEIIEVFICIFLTVVIAAPAFIITAIITNILY